MSTEVLILTVDRFEGEVAVLVDDSGGRTDVPRSALPGAAREGSVLRVDSGGGGPIWTTARLDLDAEHERRDEANAILKELRKRDRGGDLKL